MFIVMLIVIVLLAVGGGFLAVRVLQQSDEIEILQEMLERRSKELSEQLDINRKVVSQRKSSEVRTGQVAEQMAPFLKGFPYLPKDASFIGKPIDFVVFDDTGVHFVEVKSGNAQLSSSQRRIRDLINAGSVTFETYRVKGEE